MDFSNTLRGITIEGHSPLPQPPYFVFALKTFRSRSLVLANDAPTGNVFIACDPCAVDGTEEGRRGLPLLRPHRGRGDQAYRRLPCGWRHRADPRAHDEPRAARGLAADRTWGRFERGAGPGSRDEGTRPRSGKGLRLQARPAIGGRSRAEDDREQTRDEEGPAEESSSKEADREETGCQETAREETDEG